MTPESHLQSHLQSWSCLIMSLRTLLIALGLMLLALPALAAPKSRPFAGEGLLVIRPLPLNTTETCCTLPIYLDPGVERVASLEMPEVPSLAPVIKGRAGEFPLVVTAKKGDWLQVIYDDAGREGWLESSRSWDYSTWNTFLKGRAVTLLPGLRKEFYLLRRDPAPSSPQLDTLSRQRSLRIIDIKDDWALVLVDLSAYGWLRWRDGDGRFVIAVDDKFDPQKH